MNEATSNLSEKIDERIENFEANVLQNLHKNGFPGNPVAFPIDTLFEAAAKKGFSFNKIRQRLEEKGIRTSLEETRVVFSMQPLEEPRQAAGVDPVSETGGDPSFEELAKSMLSRVSPEQLKSFRAMLGELGSEQINALKAQLEALTESEKKDLLQKMAGLIR